MDKRIAVTYIRKSKWICWRWKVKKSDHERCAGCTEDTARIDVWRKYLLGRDAEPRSDFSFGRLGTNSILTGVDGVFVFWEAQAFGFWSDTSRATGNDVFMRLWGIPFLVAGNYMVWGRFLLDAWAKRHTYYAVTNRRVLVLQEAWKKKTSMMFLETIPQIEREGSATGTLWFGTKYPVVVSKGRKSRDMSRFSIGDVPVFVDIGDVDAVHRLILDLRQQTRPGSTSAQTLTYSTRN